jgi:hypothetical protein
MIYGFATPKNHKKLYMALLDIQRLEGLPGFSPLSPTIQIDYTSSNWLSMALYGIEP